MMMSQLGRVLLARPSSSPDGQEGIADGSGSYGDLMDAIDEAIERLTTDPDPSG